MTESKTKSPETTGYTYRRSRDGCDETWDIYDPTGQYVASVPYWDVPERRAEALARRIVHRLNTHDELVAALKALLRQAVDAGEKNGTVPTEGERAARRALTKAAEPIHTRLNRQPKRRPAHD